MKVKFKMYCIAHIRAAFSGLGRLFGSPFSGLLTIMVIGIALALPACLYILLQNAQSLTRGWEEGSTQISLYLKSGLSDIRTRDLLHQLRTNPEIANVSYISPQQGLKEFSQVLDAKTVVGLFHENPLPGVILVQPILSLRSQPTITILLNSLGNLPEVDSAQLDLEWLQRLVNIINLVKQGVYALAFLLGIGVLFIVGNTIHLATQNERKEISILKLVGATDAFIRRPFLYVGVWYGLFGSLIALILVSAALSWLQNPAAKLASSYNSDFYLHNLNFSAAFCLFIISILLGLISSWFVVSRELKHTA
jgi:cell division transport system permease protein